MQMKPQNTYSFDTRAPGLLQAHFKNAVLLGEMGYEMAITGTSENIDLRYRQILPVLPPGTPNSPKKQTYYRFRTESGAITTLCEQWIDMDTVELVTAINFEVRFAQAQPSDINKVRDLLTSAGFTKFVIS